MDSINERKEYVRKSFENASKLRLDNQKGLDNVIFIISTGIFVLSINYINGSNLHFAHTNLLIYSWVLIGLCVVLHAIGYMFGDKLGAYTQEKLTSWNLIGNFNPNDDKSEFLSKIISWLGYFSMFFLLSGVTLLMIFASKNILASNKLNEEKMLTGISATSTTTIINNYNTYNYGYAPK